jgi:hypothetical protein
LIARRTWKFNISSAHISYVRISHHGVLSHQDDTLTTEGASNLVHLLGADIVNADDEDRVVLLEKALELLEVAGLVGRSGT